MKIICDTTFLDGRDRFEAGEARVVSDERGAYFIAQRWAHEEGAAADAAADAGAVNLNVQGGKLAQESNHG